MVQRSWELKMLERSAILHFDVFSKSPKELEPILIDTVKVAETYISGNREYVKE